ncbi:MAG: hypothetical protein AB7E85_01380 [Pseudobdellovibrionaceae bacterium]
MSKDGTLISIGEINELLFNEHFCVPPYNSVNGQWITECFEKINTGELDKLKFHVTKEVVLPWRRAYQATYFYSTLAPFEELIKVIDAATIAYYEDNWFCSYMTLTPVIEAVIDRWGKSDIADYNEHSPLAKKAESVLGYVKAKLNPEIYWHQHLLLQHKYVAHICEKVFFINGTRYNLSNQDGFNRNVMLHLLSVPDIFINNLHTLRLFLLLDILAILYVATHPEECSEINPVFDATHKQDLMDSYFGVYKSCAIRSIKQGNYNITLQKRIYEPYNM